MVGTIYYNVTGPTDGKKKARGKTAMIIHLKLGKITKRATHTHGSRQVTVTLTEKWSICSSYDEAHSAIVVSA